MLLTGTGIKRIHEALTAQAGANEIYLKYFKYEGQTEDKKVYYGVCIQKLFEDEAIEEICVNLSESKECADFIIRYLAKNTVTPMCAAEVIDYLYDLFFSA